MMPLAKIKPIRSDLDCENALREIERLWDLSRRRSLTLRMIRRLHAEFGIPLESLIAETKRRRRRKPIRKHLRKLAQ